MAYTHLTQDERYQIAILAKANHDQSTIANLRSRHKSTISRELRRNRGLRAYRLKQAHTLALKRMTNCANGPRIAQTTWDFAKDKLGQSWGYQQISGYLLINDQPGISHETIYHHTYADKLTGGAYTAPCAAKKVRKKRYAGRQRRATIANQLSIDARPSIVGERARFGDWEADLVIDAGHKQALVTINQRTSHYCMMAHVAFKTA